MLAEKISNQSNECWMINKYGHRMHDSKIIIDPPKLSIMFEAGLLESWLIYEEIICIESLSLKKHAVVYR